MPVHEGKYQCLKCEDVFEAKSGSYTKCKCKESEIEPNYFGYSYRNGNRVETIEHKTYYLEDEFAKLPDDAQEIYQEIKDIKEQTGYQYYLFEMHETGKEGERYLSQINLEHNVPVSLYTSERNTISLTIQLRKRDYRGDEITKARLEKFLNYMKLIESNELDASNRRKLFDIAKKDDLEYREEPTGDVNYTFYL
ncbi:hypothetical protein [Bacillus cereus group sp. BfR-BA-00999]|uniref:hypothetical protein n=1 Tax=Bacillus cereus group sp. BfR-BA-00999 TaxID=3094871 RepID=UPI0029C33B07|nr:hypothetical protein [Bacillus cereus group sp. BfR-BA-00999]MDX5884954.1 hypothetical protein [Bacillus cereus group sp. BfR-BA-00999]